MKNRQLAAQKDSPLNIIVAYLTFTVGVMLFLLPMFSGCGRTEKRIKVVPVTGKVTFAGEVPAGATIVLHPVGKLEVADVAPSATVKNDGTFKISVYGDGDGAPPGEYVATIEWFKIVTGPNGDGGGRGPNVIPVKYSRKDLSPVKVTVTDAPTELPPITITR
ncbi:hypothetical protein ETAA8_20160 [Anatilimnocola aggregata]|uniref:Carboxypeptidase regulatory-like domain-containing protein n=1 Tax=Anatilimnocola aggregata TaxID=2528021 RepID=A0A517Y9U6_9BACT|nr:hypothetical protein [Anatilimnocola aggregata]QDU26932.1 hypothetical protein ETAA8_20160 [Anatilimnocola aggregata]